MKEYHVASFIVRCHGEHLIEVNSSIDQISGAQIHEQDPLGKIIVTAEGHSHKQISHITEEIRDMTHVIDIAAVYHEYTLDEDEQKGYENDTK